MLFTLFLGGVILWIIAKLMEGPEKARRKRDLDIRIAEMHARAEAAWKEHDETFPAKIRELYERGF